VSQVNEFFPLPQPVQPSGRRKNAARPGVTFPPPEPEDVVAPNPEEIQRMRVYFASELDDGTDCPCCTRYAQRQPRPLGKGPALWLLELVYVTDAELELPKGRVVVGRDVYCHTRDILDRLPGGGTDGTSVLPLYGFIKALADGYVPPPDNPTAAKPRTNGFWTLTTLGRAWAMNEIRAPERVVTAVGNPERFLGGPWGIRDALGDGFDYDEALSRILSAMPNRERLAIRRRRRRRAI